MAVAFRKRGSANGGSDRRHLRLAGRPGAAGALSGVGGNDRLPRRPGNRQSPPNGDLIVELLTRLAWANLALLILSLAVLTAILILEFA